MKTMTEINHFTDAHMALLKARNTNKVSNPYANDLLLDRHKLLTISNERILNILKTMYPSFELYALPSLDWRTTATYIAKARGKRGDVVLSWI